MIPSQQRGRWTALGGSLVSCSSNRECNGPSPPPDFSRISFTTGFPNLLADKKLDGGGIHMTGLGRRFDVHIDFNYLETAVSSTPDKASPLSESRLGGAMGWSHSALGQGCRQIALSPVDPRRCNINRVVTRWLTQAPNLFAAIREQSALNDNRGNSGLSHPPRPRHRRKRSDLLSRPRLVSRVPSDVPQQQACPTIRDSARSDRLPVSYLR
jgi:hypothetical protein